MQQPDAGQIAHGALHAVALRELVRSAGYLAGQIGNRQQHRVPVQDVHQDDAR